MNAVLHPHVLASLQGNNSVLYNRTDLKNRELLLIIKKFEPIKA